MGGRTRSRTESVSPQPNDLIETAPPLLQTAPADPGRPPQLVLPGLWLFAPNRDTGGGSSWLVEAAAAGEQAPLPGDLLIDCPAWSQANRDWLVQRGGPGTIVLTGRQGHGRCRQFQQALGWEVLVQEQEAYLLPGVERLRSFGAEHVLAPGVRLLWTPGPSPGSCVLHLAPAGLDGLFCGRLLQPLGPGRLAPLATPGTFHWPRQLRSLERLRQWLPAGSPAWIACGGGLGALRGEKLVRGFGGLPV